MSFSLASHCSKGWSERSGPITEQSLLANSRRDQKLRHSLKNIVSRHCNFSKGLGNLVGIETSNQVWQLCTFQSRIKLKLFVWSYCFYFFCIHPKVAHIQPPQIPVRISLHASLKEVFLLRIFLQRKKELADIVLFLLKEE